MTVLEELRNKIKLANKAYWVDNNPIMSDTDYDTAVESLRRISPDDPLLNEIGSEKLGDDKVKHASPMRSLAKFYKWEEIVNWAASVARSDDEIFMASPKYDGLSLELNGERIVTRGDGIEGTDITFLSGHIHVTFDVELIDDKLVKSGVVLSDYLDHIDDVYGSDRMVGELLVSNERFQTLKMEFPSVFGKYKTPRNLVAGFANSKADSIIASLEYGSHPVHIADFVNHRAIEIPVTLRELKEGRNIVQEVNSLVERPEMNYPTDGVVIRLNDDVYANSLGATDHHPRGAMSFKFTSQQATVILKNIQWQLGESHMTPVAYFDPVQMKGAAVKCATLHNPDWMTANKVHIGSKMVIERRGHVIPRVMWVEDDGQPADPVPTKCSYCGKDLKKNGSFLDCVNPECSSRIIKKIVRGIKDILGLKGFGQFLVTKVKNLEEQQGNKIMDIIDLVDRYKNILSDTEDQERLISLGLTKHEVSQLCDIETVLRSGVTPEQIVASVCVPKCSKEFATAYVDIANGEPLLRGSIGEITEQLSNRCNCDSVKNFIDWYTTNSDKYARYVSLFQNIERAASQPTSSSGVVCFTGAGPYSRKDMKVMALRKGYSVTDNANQCTILVASNVTGDSSKLKKARAKGITVIDYDAFLGL